MLFCHGESVHFHAMNVETIKGTRASGFCPNCSTCRDKKCIVNKNKDCVFVVVVVVVVYSHTSRAVVYLVFECLCHFFWVVEGCGAVELLRGGASL
jgi:hypothetical protein